MTANGGGAAPGHALAWSAEPLLTAYDAALLDLDGVLYLGDDGVPHAADAVAAARAAGMRAAFVTNNASRAPAAVAEHLSSLGIPAEPEDVVTSGQAAVRLVAEQVPRGAPVLVVGSDALADLLAGAGLRPVRSVEAAGEGGPAALVQGLSPDTTWRDLAEAAVAVRGGALWVTGNVDATLPTGRGQLPGNGTMVAAVETCTGRHPVVAGKPEPALHEESVQRVGSERPLVVGDRLDTDVLGAVRAGAHSLLVLTGVVDVPALLTAPAGSRPTYVSADLRGLLVPHPEVTWDDDGAALCGGSRARVTGGRLQVHPADHPAEGGLSALRAACTAAWTAADAGDLFCEVAGLPGA